MKVKKARMHLKYWAMVDGVGVQQFVRAGASNAVWMLGKYCEAAACRVVVARGGHAQQTMGGEVTAASLAGLHGRWLGAGWALGW